MSIFPAGLLPALLHRANSYPGWIDKDRFYSLKSKLLERRAECRWADDGRETEERDVDRC